MQITPGKELFSPCKANSAPCEELFTPYKETFALDEEIFDPDKENSTQARVNSTTGR